MARSGKTITFATDLLPNEDNVYNLGNSTQKWKIPVITQPSLTGTGTTGGDQGSSNTTTRYKPAVWTFSSAGITPTDGDEINIKQPCAMHDYGTWLTLDGSTYYPVVQSNGSRGNWFSNGVAIKLYFDAGGTASVFAIGGAMSRSPITGVWRIMTSYDSNSNDTGYYILSNGFRMNVGSNKIFPYTLFAQVSDGSYESFVTSSSNGTSKTRNTHGFLPTGKIYWNSNNSTYNAGLRSFSPYEQYHSIDYRYTFNISTTGLPASVHTYIKYTYDTTTNLLYLAENWLATALPTTDDGFIYQRIGSNYYDSADYRGSLILNNNYYKFENNKLKVWTGGTFSGSLTGNAATATQLATSKTIWGQSFDGTDNVTGDMTDVGPNLLLPSGQSNFAFGKSDSTAANGQFGKLGLNSNYSKIKFNVYTLDVNGNAIIYNSTAASTTKNTGQFQVANAGGGNVAIELRRGQLFSSGTTVNTTNGYGSWMISVESDILHFRSDYSGTTQQSTYSHDVLKLNNQSGEMTLAGNIIPATNDTHTLGNTTHEFSQTYSKKFTVEQQVTLQWNSTDSSLDFIFA